MGSPRSVSDEDAGMTAFVAKPVRAAELLEVLNAVL
ncbi:MAG: CheY-like chemotaxis protein [Pseudoalteromonas distincta]